MPVTGVEPVRYRYHRILSPARLPIPSHRLVLEKFPAYFVAASRTTSTYSGTSSPELIFVLRLRKKFLRPRLFWGLNSCAHDFDVLRYVIIRALRCASSAKNFSTPKTVLGLNSCAHDLDIRRYAIALLALSRLVYEKISAEKILLMLFRILRLMHQARPRRTQVRHRPSLSSFFVYEKNFCAQDYLGA